MNWWLCLLLGHKQVVDAHTEMATESGPCMSVVHRTCARRGCKWEITVWEKGVLT